MTMPTSGLNIADLAPLLPELVLLASTFALLMIDLFIGQVRKVWTHFLSVAILVVVLSMLVAGVGGQGAAFHGMFVRDSAADMMKV
ncbi:NADH:ubiquinone oxidoreductase subunit N, partial [Xylella fastidiosa subsp. multiplex]|nr:NADH:ubiquinone oxidoreductase subunit N [Xylella fastidiosa subsp. multiplex]